MNQGWKTYEIVYGVWRPFKGQAIQTLKALKHNNKIQKTVHNTLILHFQKSRLGFTQKPWQIQEIILVVAAAAASINKKASWKVSQLESWQNRSPHVQIDHSDLKAWHSNTELFQATTFTQGHLFQKSLVSTWQFGGSWRKTGSSNSTRSS